VMLATMMSGSLTRKPESEMALFSAFTWWMQRLSSKKTKILPIDLIIPRQIKRVKLRLFIEKGKPVTIVNLPE
jgi:hypothetical protein